MILESGLRVEFKGDPMQEKRRRYSRGLGVPCAKCTVFQCRACCRQQSNLTRTTEGSASCDTMNMFLSYDSTPMARVANLEPGMLRPENMSHMLELHLAVMDLRALCSCFALHCGWKRCF